MNFFATIIVLLSINMIEAKSMLRSQNSLDDQILEKTCLGKYTGVFHSFIYFAENSTSNDYYVIRTPWLLTYPGRIIDELESRNMTIIDKSQTKKCGWTTLAHVSKAGASTGSIYKFKNDNTICEDNALEILSDIYPSIEMALLVIGGSIALVIGLILYGIICM
jgi:hypothetical protein